MNRRDVVRLVRRELRVQCETRIDCLSLRLHGDALEDAKRETIRWFARDARKLRRQIPLTHIREFSEVLQGGFEKLCCDYLEDLTHYSDEELRNADGVSKRGFAQIQKYLAAIECRTLKTGSRGWARIRDCKSQR